jgi:hypothetical protein
VIAMADSLSRFEIFRARDAADYHDDGPMQMTPMSEVEAAGLAALGEAGADGGIIKVLYQRPGMCLSYAWLRSGYFLPLHSHDSDCLYFVIAGSLKLGSEELGPGDGFFVGPDVPYAYVPGEQGLELLEFRTTDRFDYKSQARNPDYWQKAIAHMLAATAGWHREPTPPSGMKVGQPRAAGQAQASGPDGPHHPAD